jgi:uncharacterized protein YndB with AHSA1/START domain
MSASGVYREIVVPERIVASETFDPPWYPGECIISLSLRESGGMTTLTQTLQYESNAAREVVIQSPMESGVVMSYDRLEEILTSSDFVPTQK